MRIYQKQLAGSPLRLRTTGRPYGQANVCDVAQNARIQAGYREKVDEKLQRIVRPRHQRASASARKFDVPGPLVIGGNIAGFRRVAEAMIEQGRSDTTRPTAHAASPPATRAQTA